MAIKMRAITKFPATVNGTNGVNVIKANGTYTFQSRFRDFAVSTPSTDLTQQQVPVFQPGAAADGSSDTYLSVPFTQLAAAATSGTSTTSLMIATGSVIFATQSNLSFKVGARVRASHAAAPANYMEGLVTNYTGSALTILVSRIASPNGTGPYADWNLNAAGDPGSGDLLSTNNLSDLTNKLTARQSIGLFDVKSYNASGSATTTTGTISSGSPTLTLAAAIDFANNQGILVFGAGAASSVGAPTITGVVATNTTGATTYNYRIASLDNQGGLSAPTSATTIANGFATLGTYGAGTTGIAMNKVTWTLGSGSPLATVVWRSIGAGAYVLLGCFLGTSIYDAGIPTQTIAGIPATPPASAVPTWLATTISSGGGTTTLTLAANAGSAATTTLVQHDDTAAINTAMAAQSAITFLSGTYNVRGLQIPSTVKSVTGPGNGAASIVSFAQTSDGLTAGVSAAMASTKFIMTGMKIVAANPMAYDCFTVSAAARPLVSGNEFTGGRWSLRVVSSANPIITGNQISAWWDIGIYSDSNSESLIQHNIIGPISGQVGSIALTVTPTGSAYAWGTGINTLGGFGNHITSNIVLLFGGCFGISGQDGGAVIENNVIKYSGREAIAAGGTLGSNFKVHGNYCYWQAAGNGNQSCYDFGMSMSDDGTHAITNGDVSNNTFINSGFSAIAVFGIGAAYTNVRIGGNSIFGSNQLNLHTSGIELSGSAVSTVLVDTNFFQSPGANMAYQVAEVNSGTGTPNNNTINGQLGPAGTTGTVLIGGANSIFLDGFIPYVPTVVCSQSTGTATGTATGRYRVQGKKVELTIDITTSGVFTGGLFTSATLPFTAVNLTGTWVFAGRESNTSGIAWIGTVIQNASTLIATNYNNSATIVTGQKITFTGWYERA